MNDKLIKLTPLHTTVERLGAKFVEMENWRFPETFRSTDEELALIDRGCGLADVTAHGKIQIEGDHAMEVVTLAFKEAPAVISSHTQTEMGHLFRLRRELFYLSTPPGGELQAEALLIQVIDECKLFVTVTDLTHGLAEILLIGPAAPKVLSKVCGLNFHPSTFPDETAKQASVAKTRQLILRRAIGGFPTFSIIGARSFAAYLWNALLAAGQEFSIGPVGVATLKRVEGGRI